MNVTYRSRPIEGRFFHLSAEQIAGRASFKAYINGELFWEEECPDPPCHEECRIPQGIAGGTLLINIRDFEEEHELTFFINDDGEGVAQKPVVKIFA